MLLTARYVLPVSQHYIEHGAVLVNGDKIVEVGLATDMRRKYPQEEIRDFGMAAIMPGFIDCHSHLEYSIMRGILNDVPFVYWKAFITEKSKLLTRQDWFDSAVLGAYEAVSSGITTIADITDTGASLAAAEHIGLRGIIYREIGSSDRKNIDRDMQEAINEIEAWKHASTSGRFRIGIGPDSLYTCHPQVLREVARYAASEHVPVAIHLAGSQEECDFIRYGSSPFSIASDSATHMAFAEEQSLALLPAGCSPVQYALNWDILDIPEVLAIHCVKLDDHDIKTLAAQNISVAVCPRANAKLGMGVAPIIQMRQAGINVGLGTDSPAAADSIDPIEEMRFTMLALRATNGKNGFIEGPDMIQMATLDSAKALHMDHIIGSLDPGKQADIVVIDLSHSNQAPTHFPTSAIVHTADRDNILLTMVGGTVVFDASDRFGHVQTADMREIRRIVGNVEKLRLRLRSE
ncbi:MAG: amidohydrolase family protein [Coriobacteriales bacterium]|nr:amidohydrolase family protein [Coriobacteriales bacterium]